jgi:5'-3' exonuclease
MDTIALIDGDIFAYEAAAGAEKPIDWGDGLWTLHAFEDEAQQRMTSRIEALAESVGADRIIVALSDKENWRYGVLPTYKSNRIGIRRPMLLGPLKEHLKETYEVFIRPTMEADDVLGILSTWSNLKGRKIIITKDKDLQTIPGLHYLSHKEELGVFEVTQEQADHMHLLQAITGDTTDGYAGCPGIGPETAKKILDDPHGWEQYSHTFKTGPRAGTAELRWQRKEVSSIWEAIVSHYSKAGLSEQEALRQARVARICRASDYDWKKKEVILWNP